MNNMLVHDTIGEKKVLSTYNEWIPNVSVYYIVCPWEDATGGCIVVDINNGADEPIVISNGRWMSQSELDMQR